MVALKKNELRVIVATLALILYILTLSVIGQVTSSLQPNKIISNVGEVQAFGVGICWDQSCTTQVSSINWGIIDSGSSKNVTVYTTNGGNSGASH